MDLEVIGRHALLFDDDANAAFVNSSEALVEWNSLWIDRYDVRHLLPGPPPPRLRRRPVQPSDAASMEADLDHERYLDLPSPSSDEKEQDNGSQPENVGGYHAVTFSYGNAGESMEQKNDNPDSVFRPPFPVPEHLFENMPPNEKVHQIIARTATFVSQHGGQSEIVLRVKQGDNPTFGFLMPDHRLHPYFRFLVDHQELLKPDSDSSLAEENKAHRGDHTSGALSLLGSVYGSGEDEDVATEDTPDFKRNGSNKADATVSICASHGSEQSNPFVDAAKIDAGISKNPVTSLKEKVPIIKRNLSIGAVKAGTSNRVKKGDTSVSLSTLRDKPEALLTSSAKTSTPLLEPSSEIKRVVDKIVEFIVKNGKQFEAVLIEQDQRHGRFPFLLPSNQYHPYYLKVLHKAQEARLPGKGLMQLGHGADKDRVLSKDAESLSFGSAGSEIPSDSDRKEKFKMVIGKSKKDGLDQTSKNESSPAGISVDAVAAAAILQAATRGIKNPNLELLTKKPFNGNCQATGSDGGQGSSFGSLHSSQPLQVAMSNGKSSVSVPVAKAIAENAAVAAANEADSSEASLTREQKLKAERLKRAKMFAAMIKSGAAPLKTEPVRGLSVEPSGSGISNSAAGALNVDGKEREGGFVSDNSDKSHKVEMRTLGKRLKRSYRSRSDRHEEEEEDKEEEDVKGNNDQRDHKHSRKKHHSRHSSHHSKDRHKHRKRHLKDVDSSHGTQNDHSNDEHRSSRRRYKHDSSSDDDSHCHSRNPYKYNDSSDDVKHHHSCHGHRDNSSSNVEHRVSQHQRKRHYCSFDEDEHPHWSKSSKDNGTTRSQKEMDLEEGEIRMKPELSKATEGECPSNEAHVELSKLNQDGRPPSQPSESTEVSEDLRAKVRAMLMATL